MTEYEGEENTSKYINTTLQNLAKQAEKLPSSAVYGAWQGHGERDTAQDAVGSTLCTQRGSCALCPCVNWGKHCCSINFPFNFFLIFRETNKILIVCNAM